jgi:RimJ/RimL family protein N-acetyltransferase
MLLTTGRLVLRELVAADWAAIHEYESDPAAVRFTWHGVQTAEQTQERIRLAVEAAKAQPRLIYDLAMARANDGRLIGQCGFSRGQPELRLAELWFIIHPRWWGQGYATESTTELIRFGFSELDLHRFWGDCDPRNPASIRVLEKLGMTREGHLRQNALVQGEWCDSLVYGLLRSEWSAAKGDPKRWLRQRPSR